MEPPNPDSGHSGAQKYESGKQHNAQVVTWEQKKELAKTLRRPNHVKLVKTNGQMFQGTLMPLGIITEDIWSFILTRLTTLDRLSLCRTNSQLDTAFGANKYEWLLDQVLPYLLENFFSSEFKSHLLNMRQVCKTWRNAIDTFLESELPTRRPYQRDHPLEQVLCRRPTGYSNHNFHDVEFHYMSLKNANKLLNFPTSAKTIVSRAMCIKFEKEWSESQIQEFEAKLRSFLQAHGDKLWDLLILVENEQIKLSVFYGLLCEHLLLMPNLKFLSVGHFAKSLPNYWSPFVSGPPLPDLANLRCLFLSLPSEMTNYFVQKYGSQLQRLSTRQYEEPKNVVVPTSVVQLESLFLSPFTCLYPTQQTPSKVQSLTLHLVEKYIEADDLNEILRQHPQLVKLCLVLRDEEAEYVVGRDQGLEFCQFPGVESFELETCSNKNYFSFCSLLMAFPNLKYLHLRNNEEDFELDGKIKPTKVDKRVEIERYLSENRIEESPIWDTLDDLQVLTVKDELRSFMENCTREQVDRYKNEFSENVLFSVERI